MNAKILTPEQAKSLLADGEYIHNYANPTDGVMIGADYKRTDAIDALNSAIQIEIGGEQCRAMNHALVVWENEHKCTFFATDPERIEEFEVMK